MAIDPGEAIEAADFVGTPSGAADSGKVPKLDGDGRLDPDFLPAESPYGGGDKEFFVPLLLKNGNVYPYTSTRGNKPTAQLNNTNDVWFTFRVPDDFGTLVSALLYISNAAGGTLQGDFSASWGANNESAGVASDSSNDVTDGVAFGTIGQLSFAAALDGIAAGDLVGVQFNCDTDNTEVFGAWMKYTPV